MSGTSTRIIAENKQSHKGRPNAAHPNKVDCSKPPPGLEQLYAVGQRFENFQKNGQGFKACCPAHDDSNFGDGYCWCLADAEGPTFSPESYPTIEEAAQALLDQLQDEGVL